MSKTNSNRPVMVTNFSPRNPDISKLIRENWNTIQNTEKLQSIFPDQPIMGFRRLPNLRDKLTSVKIKYIPSKNQPNQNIFYLSVPDPVNAITAPKSPKKTALSVSSPRKNISAKTSHLLTCELSNLIYLINCTKCGFQYIGETKIPLRPLRMYEHFRSVQNKKLNLLTLVSRSFSRHGHIWSFLYYIGWEMKLTQMTLQAIEAGIILQLGNFPPYT